MIWAPTTVGIQKENTICNALVSEDAWVFGDMNYSPIPTSTARVSGNDSVNKETL